MSETLVDGAQLDHHILKAKNLWTGEHHKGSSFPPYYLPPHTHNLLITPRGLCYNQIA